MMPSLVPQMQQAVQGAAFPGMAESSLLGREAMMSLGGAFPALCGMPAGSFLMGGLGSGMEQAMMSLMQGMMMTLMIEMMKKILELLKKLTGDGEGAASTLGGSLGGFLGTSGGGGASGSPGASGASGASSSSAPAATGTGNVDASGHAFPVAGIKPGSEIKTHWGSGERGGTDIFAPEGTPVCSSCNGTVENAGNSGISGNRVTIKGDDGLTYFYAHLQNAPMVSSGQKVKAGQQIGNVGDTGNAKGTGHHLHLGIGYGIKSGSGAQGGCGNNFDAVSFLQKILNGG